MKNTENRTFLTSNGQKRVGPSPLTCLDPVLEMTAHFWPFLTTSAARVNGQVCPTALVFKKCYPLWCHKMTLFDQNDTFWPKWHFVLVNTATFSMFLLKSVFLTKTRVLTEMCCTLRSRGDSWRGKTVKNTEKQQKRWFSDTKKGQNDEN